MVWFTSDDSNRIKNVSHGYLVSDYFQRKIVFCGHNGHNILLVSGIQHYDLIFLSQRKMLSVFKY